MNFRDCINQNQFILMEGALGERLKREYGLPFVATTPTRRANRERIEKAKCPETVIRDNVAFLKIYKELRNRNVCGRPDGL